MEFKDLIDAVVEAPVVSSFSRIGADVRSRSDQWKPLTDYDLTGRVVVLTGATSGIGRAAAEQLAACGATLLITGRSAERNQVAADEIAAVAGSALVTHFAADMGDLDQVRDLASHVLETHDRLDVLIHNAGTLSAERTEAPDGTESTIASQVVGPFLLTTLLFDRLIASAPARVITMSSGGMYTAPLSVSGLEMSPESYKGADQYARAKRAQVSLNEMFAARLGDRGVHFHAMHPGWVDTPGVDESLPTFAKLMGPVLRTPAQGADTLVWLAADDEAIETNGGFWLDRRQRSIHKLGRTRASDTVERRAKLWDLVAAKAGVEPPA